MGKYEPLARYLASLDSDSWDARFSDVEKVLGFGLPASAHEYPAWWANQENGHSQTKGWRDVGWQTSKVDLHAKRLRFVREPSEKQLPARPPVKTIQQLWRKAEDMSGITDRCALEEAVLTAFIEREAMRGLIALGGTMPDFQAAPRRQFD